MGDVLASRVKTPAVIINEARRLHAEVNSWITDAKADVTDESGLSTPEWLTLLRRQHARLADEIHLFELASQTNGPGEDLVRKWGGLRDYLKALAESLTMDADSLMPFFELDESGHNHDARMSAEAFAISAEALRSICLHVAQLDIPVAYQVLAATKWSDFGHAFASLFSFAEEMSLAWPPDDEEGSTSPSVPLADVREAFKVFRREVKQFRSTGGDDDTLGQTADNLRCAMDAWWARPSWHISVDAAYLRASREITKLFGDAHYRVVTVLTGLEWEIPGEDNRADAPGIDLLPWQPNEPLKLGRADESAAPKGDFAQQSAKDLSRKVIELLESVAAYNESLDAIEGTAVWPKAEEMSRGRTIRSIMEGQRKEFDNVTDLRSFVTSVREDMSKWAQAFTYRDYLISLRDNVVEARRLLRTQRRIDGALRVVEYTTAWCESEWPYLEVLLTRLQTVLVASGRLLVAIDATCASLGYPPEDSQSAADLAEANKDAGKLAGFGAMILGIAKRTEVANKDAIDVRDDTEIYARVSVRPAMLQLGPSWSSDDWQKAGESNDMFVTINRGEFPRHPERTWREFKEHHGLYRGSLYFHDPKKGFDQRTKSFIRRACAQFTAKRVIFEGEE